MDDGLFKPKEPKSFASSEREREEKRKSFASSEREREEGRRQRGEDFVSAERATENAELNKSGGSLSEIKENEEKPGGLYSGTGKSDKKKGKGKFKGRFKKGGPIIAIFIAILGFSGMSFFGMSMELVAWKENLSSMFGQGSAVISRRSNYMMRTLLGDNSHKGTLKNTIFGDTKFKIGSKLQQKFKENGIDYVEETVDGKKIKMLVFEDADGQRIPVFANESDVQRAKSLNLEIDGKKIDFNKGTTLVEAKTNNKKFSVSYDDATITFTGKIAGWFDNMTDALYERIVGKNARNQTDIDDPDEEKVNKMLLGNASEGLDDSEVDVIKKGDDGEDEIKVDSEAKNDSGGSLFETGEDGKQKLSADSEKAIKDVINKKGGILADSPSAEKVRSALNNRGMKAAMMASNAGCMVLKAVGAVNVAVGAVQTANVIQYASKYLELADKIKAGQADEVVNIAMNNLNTRMSTTIKMDGEEHDIDGSVTESAGWGQVFSSTNIINENDPSAMYTNRELVGKVGLKQALGDGVLRDVIGGAMNIGAGIKAFRLCNGLQIFGAIIDGLSDVASLLTLGVAGLVKEFIEGAVKGLALSAAVTAIGIVINLVTPVVANWFAGMLTEAFLGKNGGFALLSGAQNIMNSNLQMSTGRYADNENAKEVFALTQDVEREWAAYERATRSPFDITSKYTFLGSMYNSALPLIHSSRNSVMGTISSVANLASNSAISIVSPSVSAADETNKFANSLATEGNCAFLQSAGVAGDFACNKYAGAYVSELTTESPGDIYERMKNHESFEMDNNEVILDNDGNPKIDSGSEYAKYIVACVVSDNQPGTVSASVQGFMSKVSNPSESFVVNGLINVGKSIVPFLDSGTDLFEGFEEKKNLQWNAGLACTGNTDDPELNQRIKDYSMYNLDQRVLYDMGVIENNSTVSFLEDYYKENPLDHSFEGTIARFSGMSKEQVEDTLALIDYYQFLNEYDASDRFAFGEPAVKVEKELKFDNDNKLANNYFLLPNQISFADVRNRNFAI